MKKYYRLHIDQLIDEIETLSTKMNESIDPRETASLGIKLLDLDNRLTEKELTDSIRLRNVPIEENCTRCMNCQLSVSNEETLLLPISPEIDVYVCPSCYEDITGS